jgi:type II secretory pathway component PulK
MSGRRAGFVLIAALWLLVALGAVGLDAALRSRNRRLAAANLVDETRARAAALAGAEYVRSRLTAAMLDRADELRADALSRARNDRARQQAQGRSVSRLFRDADDPMNDPWRAPDELIATEMTFGDARYSVRVRDTGAALNLNEASEEVLRQFFSQGMGVDYARSDRLTQAILDWRDEDELPRINGGEREQYLREGALILPPNRDFAEIAELRHVMGMTPDLFDAARPFLTIFGSGDVNVNAAPLEVLLALPAMTPGTAQEIVRMRDAGNYAEDEDELVEMLGGAGEELEDSGPFGRMTTYATNEVEIVVDGRVEGSPMVVRARVIVARSDAGAVVVWRRID